MEINIETRSRRCEYAVKCVKMLFRSSSRRLFRDNGNATLGRDGKLLLP